MIEASQALSSRQSDCARRDYYRHSVGNSHSPLRPAHLIAAI